MIDFHREPIRDLAEWYAMMLGATLFDSELAELNEANAGAKEERPCRAS
jgi:hypothetical protein